MTLDREPLHAGLQSVLDTALDAVVVMGANGEIIGGHVELIWAEHGPTCERDGRSSGFGERMIAMSAKSDLGGSIEREWRAEGLKLVLCFPA